MCLVSVLPSIRFYSICCCFFFTWNTVATLLGRYFVLAMESHAAEFQWFPVIWVSKLLRWLHNNRFHIHLYHIYRLMKCSWSDRTCHQPIPCKSTESCAQPLKMMALLSWIDWNQLSVHNGSHHHYHHHGCMVERDLVQPTAWACHTSDRSKLMTWNSCGFFSLLKNINAIKRWKFFLCCKIFSLKMQSKVILLFYKRRISEQIIDIQNNITGSLICRKFGVRNNGPFKCFEIVFSQA